MGCRERGFATASDCDHVVEELRELVGREPSPCRVAGTMVAEAFDAAMEAYRLFAHVNYNDPRTFHSVVVLRERLEGMLSDLLGVRARLVYTYGASESTLTALYAFREAYGVRYVVASAVAHASVFKACRVLGLRCLEAPVRYDLTVDVDAVERILASLPDRVQGPVVGEPGGGHHGRPVREARKDPLDRVNVHR